MRLVFHPSVAADVARIMRYYEDVGDERLAQEFYAELKSVFLQAATTPERYAIRTGDLRRASLERFPYHFLFRIAGDQIRILVVRHHSRHPALGASRR